MEKKVLEGVGQMLPTEQEDGRVTVAFSSVKVVGAFDQGRGDESLNGMVSGEDGRKGVERK